MTEKKKIYLSSPTMHGDEQKFVQEAFDTNWIAPLGPNVNGFEKEMEAYSPYVTLVDAGDAVQGAPIGTLSDGEYIIDSTFPPA